MMKNSFWLLLIFFAFFNHTSAQVALPFKAQKEFFIYGNATVIGNAILGKEATAAFNDVSLTNDDIDMVYTDVDNDDTTFSSSSATLQLPANHSEIKYAVLYWAATYSYEQGYRTESGEQFLFQGKRVKNRNAISKVKFKLPNAKNYIPVNGDVVFDGANDPAFSLNAPYVCQADVTKLLKNASIINGEYTLANVTASKGFVSGGSAAGWLLYVVYEAPVNTPQYITMYNGFAHVGNEAVKITFDNFKALEEGEIKTSITLSALEGDSALIDDEILISNPVLKRMSLLSSNLRPRNNFFNSKITTNDSEFTERNPASKNTLGFDIATVDIPNQTQPIIDNNTEKVDLIFNTRADRFYLFFTAFQTEISTVFYEEQQQEYALIEDKLAPKITSDKSKKEVSKALEKKSSEEPIKGSAPKIRTEISRDIIKEVSRDERNVINTSVAKETAEGIVEDVNSETKDGITSAKGLEQVVNAKVKKEKVPKKEVVKKGEKITKNQEPIVKEMVREEIKPWERKPENTNVGGPEKEATSSSIPKAKTLTNPLPRADYSQSTKDKTLPVWLKQKQEVEPRRDNIYRPSGQIILQQSAQNSLALNRDNYEKLLTVEDYIYETQTFKRILNQETTFINGIDKGYYIIATLVYDFDEAIGYQNALKGKGVNSKIFKDKGDSYYVYLYNSDNFYDVFMLRKAFIKAEFLSKVWILNINMKAGTLKKI
ncbi:hypothetical protein ES676_08305 [Bizionia saleffrena]|uniref:Uncharacterized protein n=1 Tax=Bizionia saleffrena TaxID=291189 RepID=A0A8H2QLG3_9FLAO|nr:hypothetical protein [Bizionia saleffrena]TYB74175.1 hypothetical protein ES676_08305 [Bizionia saleffrena]